MLACRAVRRVLAFSACCALLAGCGGGARQDAAETTGSYDLQVVTSQFPREQRLSQGAVLRLDIRNTGKQTAPNLAVSLDGLMRTVDQPGLSDPHKPVWIVERQPVEGQTAYEQTWAVGPLPAGGSRRLEWRLAPAVSGTHTLKWTIAAGLHGKAVARTSNGGRPTGTFTVRVSQSPGEATVDPETGRVIRK